MSYERTRKEKKNGQSHNMSADKDILTKEIESWAGFTYALRKENRTLFEEMSDGCKKTEYVDCAAAKGESFSRGFSSGSNF